MANCNVEFQSMVGMLFFTLVTCFCIYVFVCFSGLLHQSGRPDVFLQERQTSLQETRSYTENVNLGLLLAHFCRRIFCVCGKASK